MYIKLNMPQSAEKYAKELIKIDTKNRGYNFYKLAYIYYLLKNYDESIHYLDLSLNEGHNVIGSPSIIGVLLS